MKQNKKDMESSRKFQIILEVIEYSVSIQSVSS